MTYEHDIFVSYAHVDNTVVPGTDQGWVTSLAVSISETLKQTLGRFDVKVWMDYRLSGNEPLTEQLLEAVRRSLTLLVIQSPGYVNSSWCNRERNAFLAEVQRRKSSVFVVERRPIEPGKRPAEFRDLRGYKFWAADPLGRSLRLFGHPTPQATDREYYSVVNDICRDLAAELEPEPSLDLPGCEHPPQLGLSRKKIFLAEVTDDLISRRDEIKRYLSQVPAVDIEVVPTSYYPLQPDEFCEAVRSDLEGCDLFIQLLSSVPGRPVPGRPYGYAKLQFDLASEAGKQMLQWRSPDIDLETVTDPVHREFLQGKTVWAEALEDFKKALEDKLTPSNIAEPDEKISGKFIFVNRGKSDEEIAKKVHDFLFEKKHNVVLPIDTNNNIAVRQDLESSLSYCDGMIIIYGRTTVDWVRQQLLQCRKAFAARDRTLKALALYECPPVPKERPNVSLQGMRVVNGNGGGLDGALKQFLSDLAAG